MNLFTWFHVAVGYRLRIVGCELRVAGCELRVAGCGLPPSKRIGCNWRGLLTCFTPYSVFSHMHMIREAEAKDVSALSNLYHQLVRSVAPDTMIDVREDRIEQIRTDPHNFLFVLEMKDRLCGSAFLTLCLDPLSRYQTYALLENFVIDQGQQGKGYGTILARYVEHFCLPGGLLENHVAEQQQAF
jgi:GNAT superfamily N-acetyltransferase